MILVLAKIFLNVCVLIKCSTKKLGKKEWQIKILKNKSAYYKAVFFFSSCFLEEKSIISDFA